MYPPHVRNILKLSVNQQLPEAFHEWSFAGEMRDDAHLDTVCGLCGTGEIRFEFRIRNASTDAELDICSVCIGRYPIAVFDDGQRLSPRDKKNFLHQLTVRQMHQTCKEVIRRVRSTAPDLSVESVMTYYERNYELSPTHAAVLFTRVEPQELPSVQTIFSIQTRSANHKQEFGSLNETERLSLWPALTQIQRKRLTAMGLAPRKRRRRADSAAPGSGPEDPGQRREPTIRLTA